jgi:hypothetical protein
MDVNEDFVDIAKVFIDNGVEFLVVGAYALAAHGSRAPLATSTCSCGPRQKTRLVYFVRSPSLVLSSRLTA